MPILLKQPLKIAKRLEDVNFISHLDTSKPHVKVGILNLMPTLEDTERDLIKVLDTKFLQVELDFIYLDTKKQILLNYNIIKNIILPLVPSKKKSTMA